MLEFSMKTFMVIPHWNRLDETVLMIGHKICFYGEIQIIIPKLSLLTHCNLYVSIMMVQQ